jgi:sugar lactone lactonase YvrE
VQEHQTTILADNFVFLEGPRWHQDELWVSDMWDLKLFRVQVDGSRKAECEVPRRPSGLGFLQDGTPVVVSMADRKLMKVVNGDVSLYKDLSGAAPGDLNDMAVDEQGRIYVGNFGYDLFGGGEKALADLLLVEPDGSSRVVASDLDFPNGMVFTDGGRTLVVAETWSCRLTAYDRADDGSLSGRRVYADLGTRMPDGICIDHERGIWVSSFNSGEFVRVLEGGEVTDRVLCEGKRAVACQLGGNDGRTLFCCTYAGTIEEIHTLKRASAIETVQVSVPAVAPGAASHKA